MTASEIILWSSVKQRQERDSRNRAFVEIYGQKRRIKVTTC